MRRLSLYVLAAVCLLPWAAAYFIHTQQNAAIIIPTLMVLPTLEPSATLTASATPSATLTPSATMPPTVTPLPTAAVRRLEFSAIMPDVVMPPPTDLPAGITVFSEPPPPLEPLPDATYTAPPFVGWYSFESDYPTIQYAPAWTPRLSEQASRGQYHRSEQAYSSALFTFEGEGLRIRYVAAQNMGQFDLLVDGVLLDTIDAYAEELRFLTTPVYQLNPGQHRLEIRATGGKHSASSGYVTGLDALHVWRGDAQTLIIPPDLPTLTPTVTPQSARVELVSAPPTVQPTGTPIPPRQVTAQVVIAYDENGNREVDPAEGVAGISMRVVETNTNRVIASGFTDASGYAVFELVTDAPAQIVVPYFGETWELERGGSAYTLLLTPGNQPGLIP